MEGTYTPVAARRNHRLQLVPSLGHDDRITRTSGLVANVSDPQTVATVLETRGFVRQQTRKCEMARLKKFDVLCAIFYSGLIISLAPSSTCMFELASMLWPFVQRDGGAS